jgi:hypothetical protein
MGTHGLNLTNSTDNTRFKLKSNHTGWQLPPCISAAPTLGLYLGVVLLDVVEGERALDWLLLCFIYVRTYVEECIQ